MSGKNRKRKSFEVLLRKFSYIFESSIFPSFCYICQSPLNPFEKIVCEECLKKVKPVGENICRICGKPLASQAPSSLCFNCVSSPPLFTLHRSFSIYEGIIRDIIFLLKFKKMSILANIVTEFAYRHLEGKDGIFDFDFIIPVPISKKRRAERGFNQSEIIAEELSKLTRKRVLRNVLIKKINTVPQSLLPLNERIKNVSGSFDLKNAEFIKDKRLLLVDDIYTSGSTINECCKVLKRISIKEIKVFTLARAGIEHF